MEYKKLGDKKYILTDETKEVDGHILHRIQAAKDFKSIHTGDLGGWIEKEENLSQCGTCWVYDQACVYEDAKLYSNSRICGYTKVHGHAEILSSSRIYGYAEIYDYVSIYGNATIEGRVKIYEFAGVGGSSFISGKSEIFGKAMVVANSRVIGSSKICGSAIIRNDATIDSAYIDRDGLYIAIGPIGSRNDCTTFILQDNQITVTCGCFRGTIDEFEAAVHKTHSGTKYEKQYMSAIQFAKGYLNQN